MAINDTLFDFNEEYLNSNNSVGIGIVLYVLYKK